MRRLVAFGALLFGFAVTRTFAGDARPPLVVDDAGGFAPSYRVLGDVQWLKRYVMAHESYDAAEVQSQLATVTLLSAPAVQAEYHRRRNGREERHRVFGSQARVEVAVTAIAFIADFQAAVRFTTRKIRGSGGDGEAPRRWIATIAYTYLPAPWKAEDRRRNPWGFRVTGYHAEPESVAVGEGKP